MVDSAVRTSPVLVVYLPRRLQIFLPNLTLGGGRGYPKNVCFDSMKAGEPKRSTAERERDSRTQTMLTGLAPSQSALQGSHTAALSEASRCSMVLDTLSDCVSDSVLYGDLGESSTKVPCRRHSNLYGLLLQGLLDWMVTHFEDPGMRTLTNCRGTSPIRECPTP